jgi:hypothetical protein
VDARDPDPPQRLQRALVLTCAAVVVGVAAHLLGGGTVEPIAVAAAFPVLLLSWPLTHRESGWLPIAGAQLAGQQVVHTLLASATDVAAPGPPVDAFVYGHVLAAVLVAVCLRRGEQRVWALARRAAHTLGLLWRRVLDLLSLGEPPRPHGVPPTPPTLPVPRPPLLRHADVRRGPPVHV